MMKSSFLLLILFISSLSIISVVQGQDTPVDETVSYLKDIILIKPVIETGPETLLICVPGFYVPGAEYVPVCEAIQKALPFRTWVTVLDFIQGVVTAIGIEKGFDQSIEKVKEAGFYNVTNSDVFVWAHSAGGPSGASLVEERQYSGYLLVGSYLSHTTIDKFAVPVLTIGGELDGLCQITKIAQEYEVFQNHLNNNLDIYREVIASKGVLVLEGINHAQMCNGFIQGKILEEDFEPEVTQEEATNLIARISSAFIRVHRTEGLYGSAYSTIESFVNRTDDFVSGFLQAQKDDVTFWCEQTQKITANLNDSSLLRVECVHETDFDTFVESKAQLEVQDGVAFVTTHSYLSYTLLSSQNDAQIMSQGKFATEAACKCKSQEVILDQLGSPSSGPDGMCRGEHLALFDWALNAVPLKTKSRYLSKGKQLLFLDDIEQPTGGDWVPSTLLFDTSQNPVPVAASRLYSPNIPSVFGGATYCKTLPAARAMAWILHDSLPRGLKKV